MGPKDVIAKSLDMSDFIMNKYLDDLSDADLEDRARRRHAPDRPAARTPDLGREDVHRVREPGFVARAAGRVCRQPQLSRMTCPIESSPPRTNT